MVELFCTCGHRPEQHHKGARCTTMAPSDRQAHVYVDEAEPLEPGDRRWVFRDGFDQCACAGFVEQVTA